MFCFVSKISIDFRTFYNIDHEYFLHEAKTYFFHQVNLFRGNLTLVEKAIELGCDVNEKTDDTLYTALMFAALSGKQEVCRLLMDHGARMHLVNGIGKTASELAAFVGHHECVAVINNHISIDLIEEFLRPKINGEYVGEEVYPDELATFIHSLCGSHEVHPVKIIFRFSQYPDSVKYKKKV